MGDIIKISERGSFHVGGEKVRIENAPVEDYPYAGKFIFHSDPNGTHWVRQMYVQYTRLADPVCPYPVLMWHGGGLTGTTWETTPDGREGWDTLFLRAGYSVYVSDAVERGRASWAKFPEVNAIPPVFHTFEARWLNLKMGEVYPIPYEGNRFPVDCYDRLMMQSVPRWITSDAWTQEAYDKYIEKLCKELEGVILMAHSQGAIFAEAMAKKYPDFIKALVLVEPVGFPLGEDGNEAFSKIPQLYVYGDFIGEEYKTVHPWVDGIRKTAPLWRDYLDSIGAQYTWMSLPDMGIRGNSHMLMMDDNSAEIAAMICDWLKVHVK
ncbi:MAG: hypothetical protein LIO81_08715 [Clostridiales bacterium]|nr:hypothetical protein [Clostridiales bacterium]